MRVRIDGHKSEQVLPLDSFKTTGRYSGSLALMPDDSSPLLREAGTQDVYALDWEMP